VQEAVRELVAFRERRPRAVLVQPREEIAGVLQQSGVFRYAGLREDRGESVERFLDAVDRAGVADLGDQRGQSVVVVLSGEVPAYGSVLDEAPRPVRLGVLGRFAGVSTSATSSLEDPGRRDHRALLLADTRPLTPTFSSARPGTVVSCDDGRS
jgi:hypothetical protein